MLIYEFGKFDPKTGQSALERCGRRLCTDRGQLSTYESPFQEMLAIVTEKKSSKYVYFHVKQANF